MRLLAYLHPKAFTLRILRRLYHRLPLSLASRVRIRQACQRRFPGLLAQAPATVTAPVADWPPGNREPFSLPVAERPVVSIIVPVYGQLDYTCQCLRAVGAQRTRFSYEVIVVDDCSPDDTAEVLARIQGIRMIRTPRNLGFIDACNRGAALARGHLLVFLNNDTQVRPGWLDELVTTFNRIPAAGLVGSRLLYPDGRQQEAGGILWNDASAWNYGRLQDPQRPEFSYLRDVDYCSGASLMITRTLFDQLGGFDAHFAPAYCEDCDLAMRVRRAGYRVLYQPLSQVVHYEGITSGTDTSRGVKAHQVTNLCKLQARWQDSLHGNGVPGVDPDRQKDRAIGPRLLLIDADTPTPERDARSRSLVKLMRVLQSLGGKVTFAPAENFARDEPHTSDLQRIGVECLYRPYVSSLHEHLSTQGVHYDAVLILRNAAAECSLESVRRQCPQARVEVLSLDEWHDGEDCDADEQPAVEAARILARLQRVGLPVSGLPRRDLAALDDATSIYPADWLDDPQETSATLHSQAAWQHWQAAPVQRESRARENAVISRHRDVQSYTLNGYCQVCERPAEFLVDRLAGAVERPEGWEPNWHERLVCPHCRLNSRQRKIARVTRDFALEARQRHLDIFLTEQITPFYQWVSQSLPRSRCVGSEYLGPEAMPGSTRNGVRHEDAERLSLDSASVDLIISNDVLEHVNDPCQALAEAYRVLRPDGRLLLTIPFDLRKTLSVRRASIRAGTLQHDLPPVFHGNPLSSEGALVFTDFGWDFVEKMRSTGFDEVALHFYWSELYGYLGADQHYLLALKRR